MNNDAGEANDTDVAFVGQLGVGLTRHICHGIKLRAGYEVLWIDGMVLAAEQLTTGGVRPVNSGGDILYDGGYVGLEWHR